MNNRNKKILLLEDDNAIRELLKKVLVTFDYQVVTARDGSEGIAVLKENPDTSLIIADIMMPVLCGIGFRKAQLLIPELSHIHVIFLSANNGLKDDVAPLKPYEFLNKPIDIKDLKSILDNFFLLHS